MKKFLKRSLVCILICLLISNFISASIVISEASIVGDIVDTIFTGIIGVCSLIIRVPVTAALSAINILVSGIAKLGIEGAQPIDGLMDIFITPFHIFFNKIPILDINFFKFDGVSDTVLTFRTGVAGWYYTMRLIAMMALLVILIYIGIRMAISTIASEKAMYKKMLVDWVTSLALLFLLHYIILFTFACNTALVDAVEQVVNNSGDEFDLTHFYGALAGQAVNPLEVVAGFTALIIYAIFIYVTFKFIWVYMKRMLTIGFLIIIAPLITITYSIDKIGDQKAQALNTWLKEFVYNILIQPFHCIIFAAFASVAMKVIGVGEMTWGDISIGAAVLAAACIMFIDDGEKIVRNIFGFTKASSLRDLAAGAGAVAAVMAKGGAAAATVGKGAAKAKNFISNNKSQLKELGSHINNKVAKLDRAGNLTEKGRKAAERRARKNGTSVEEERLKMKDRRDTATNVATAPIRGGAKLVNSAVQPLKEKTREFRRNRTEKKEENTRREYEEFKTQHPEMANLSLKDYKERSKKAKKYNVSMTDENFDNKVAAKEQIANRKKQIVSGYTNDFGKYLTKNKAKIMANSLGMITGMIGLGGGIAGFTAGQKIGSGLITGYMSNTNSTLNSDMSTLLNNIKDLNPNVDISNLLYQLNADNENDRFKEIAKELRDLLNKMEAMTKEERRNFEGEISKNIALGEPVDNNFIDQQLSKLGFSDSDEGEQAAERDALREQMMEYINLKLSYQAATVLAQQVEAGSSVENVIKAVSNYNTTYNYNQQEETHNHYNEQHEETNNYQYEETHNHYEETHNHNNNRYQPNNPGDGDEEN